MCWLKLCCADGIGFWIFNNSAYKNNNNIDNNLDAICVFYAAVTYNNTNTHTGAVI